MGGSEVRIGLEVRGQRPVPTPARGKGAEGLEGVGQVMGSPWRVRPRQERSRWGWPEGRLGLTVQVEGEGRTVQAAVLASGQVVVRGTVEAGLPIRLVGPQVKGAAGGQQAGGLPDSADGHVALCERGRRGRRSASPATAQPQPLRSSRAPSGATHQSSPPGAWSGAARSDTIRSGALGSRCGWCRWLSGTDTGPHWAGSQDPGVWVPLPGGGGGTRPDPDATQPSPPGSPKVGTPGPLLLGLGSLSPQPLPTLG